jgi:glycosyltransferase involved in cell wall biosynthesis
MFDYHMAGLAVITSDLPSLAAVVARSKGGIVYEAGDPASLAAAIERLRGAPDELAALQFNARRFALEEANLERELGRLADAMRSAIVSTKREAA